MLITKYIPPPVTPTVEELLLYPESDGKPVADNTKQFRSILNTYNNLELQIEDNPDIVVFGDLFWYPVEGHPEIVEAPDLMIVFGRPKGDRGSYMQWREDNIAPQVVFEILSPGNRKGEMDKKRAFYEKYGVEEYYLYDPDRGNLDGWLRTENNRFAKIEKMKGWCSPRLGVRFEMADKELMMYHPNGERFSTMTEVAAIAKQSKLWAEAAQDRADAAMERAQTAMENYETEYQRAEREKQRAEQEAQRAEQEAQRAEQEAQRAEQEKQRAEQEAKARSETEAENARLRALLAQYGITPN